MEKQRRPQCVVEVVPAADTVYRASQVAFPWASQAYLGLLRGGRIARRTQRCSDNPGLALRSASSSNMGTLRITRSAQKRVELETKSIEELGQEKTARLLPAPYYGRLQTR